MPADIVETQFDSTVGGPSRPQYNDVIVFGTATAAYANFPFNEPRNFSDPTEVANQTADGSDVHVASQQLKAMGVDDWTVVILEATQHSFDPTAASPPATPASAKHEVTATVDGNSQTVVPVTASPPDANETPSSGEVFVNYDTVEAEYGTSGGTTYELTYYSLSWTTAFDELNPAVEDIAFLADLQAGRAGIGDWDELVEWGTGDYVTIPAAYLDGREYASESEAVDASIDIGSYVSAGSFFPINHKANGDVAAYAAGLLATQRVWDDPTMDDFGAPGINQPTDYRSANIGNPETPGTFEGGSTETEGAGQANVLDTVQGVLVLRNDLTTAGNSSRYRYVDAFRVEGFVADETERALIGLALGSNRIPFTSKGQDQITNVLDNVLGQYEYEEGAYSDLAIDVPPPEEVGEDRRRNRIWGIIRVDYRLNGSAHRFIVEINPSV